MKSKFLISATLALFLTPASFANANQTVILKQLMKKIQNLENRVQTLEAQIANGGGGGDGIPTTTAGGGASGGGGQAKLTPQQKKEFDANMKKIQDYVKKQQETLKQLEEEEKQMYGK